MIFSGLSLNLSPSNLIGDHQVAGMTVGEFPFIHYGFNIATTSIFHFNQQEVWSLAPITPCFEYSGSLDLRNDWSDLCSRQALPPTGLSIGSLAPWIVWQIWKARNSLVFKDRGFSATEVITAAVAAAKEWATSQEKPPLKKSFPRLHSPVPEDCRLIRTDAAWSGKEKVAGLGWIVKERSRTSSFSAPSHFVSSPLVAEGMALREALMFCRDRGFSRVRFESDCDQLIKALTSDHPFSELYGIVADIQAISLSFECVSFERISRERNQEADVMAKQCLADELVVMASPNIG